MPKSKKDTSAKHLTKLTVDINELQKNLKQAGTDFDALAKKAQQDANTVKQSLSSVGSIGTTGVANTSASVVSGGRIGKGIVDVQQIERAALAFARLANQIKGMNLQDAGFNNLIQQARGYEAVLENLIRNARTLGTVTPQMAEQFRQVQDALVPLQRQFVHMNPQLAQLAQQYRQMQKDIRDTITTLKQMERQTLRTGPREQVAALRNEFDQLARNMHNLSLSDAQSQLAVLVGRFNDLRQTIPTVNNYLNTFVTALTNRARWMLAYGVLNTIFNSFTNTIKVIRETEDAVIELQRVLETSPSRFAMAEELDAIAFEFGQTFQNVQEVAVRFAQTGMTWEQTIDAVRATMLGLNTAELEVNTATQGLIAVMAQFDIEAEDLEEVIDKINITADNFPVTSEKIVAALQRAGGTAKAFGMTLEETIGVITALSEATGRSGESIGTAMNSLISFTMKASSLKTFSEYLGFDVTEGYDVMQIWKLLSTSINEGNEALLNMMASSKEFAGLFDKEISDALSLQNEYNDAVAHQEDVYSSVGVYRKNYFIALLNNLATAEAAMENMVSATGYSIQENETAMEALSKQFNQLIIAARELAVGFGKAGFLDLAKFVVQAATATLQLTKSLGGLSTVLLGITALIVKVKGLSVLAFLKPLSGIVEGISAGFKKASAAVTLFNASLSRGNSIAMAFRSTMLTLKLTFGDFLIVVTLVVSAINLLINGVKNFNTEQRELRAGIIQTGKEAIDNLKALNEAYNNLNTAKLSADTNALEEAQLGLLEALGYTKDDIPMLVAKYNDLDTAISKLTAATYELEKANIALALQKADKAFGDITYNIKEQFGFFADVSNYQQALDFIKKADETIASFQKQFSQKDLGTNEVYQGWIKAREAIAGGVKEYESLRGELEMLSDTYADYQRNMEEAERIAQEALDETVDSASKAVKSLEELQAEVDSMKEAFDDLSKRVDNFQGAYSTLVDVIDEYNQTGILTADMLQSLLSLEPQYLEMLETKNGTLSINNEALSNLISANDVYINQLLALKVAEEANTLAMQIKNAVTEDMTADELNAALATVTLQSDIAKAAQACLSGATDVNTFRDTIKGLGEDAGLTGQALDVFSSKAMGIMGTMMNLATMFGGMQGETDKTDTSRINRYYAPRANSGGGGSKKSQKDTLRDNLESRIEVYEHSIFLLEKGQGDANKMVAIYKKMQAEIHALAEKYRSMGVSEQDELLRNLSEKWWKYQDEIIKVLDGIYDETIKAHENSLKLLENQFDVLERGMDYSGMTDNLRKQYDIQRKIQEAAHNEAQRLRKTGVKENDEAIQACIDAWWGAEDAIQDINSKIEDSILSTYDDFLDMADKFDLWEYMDFTKVEYLQQKLGAINKLFEEGTISAKEYNNQIKAMGEALYEAQVEQFEQQKEKIKDYYDTKIKAEEKDKDTLEKQKQEEEDYYNDLKDQYNAEIDIWEKRKQEAEDYYDKLIENLQKVQDSNERINQQIDYFNERQKIITNLEQVQARSGVAWREKEMEYQQQLIDLDKEWNRTQKEWDIEDQINRLEELKKMATADIDATIDKLKASIDETEAKAKIAIENIDNDIKGIEDTILGLEQASEREIAAVDEQIKALAENIAQAVKNGTTDGLIDVSKEFDKASQNIVTTLGGKLVESLDSVKTSSKTVAKDSVVTFNNMMFEPIKSSITSVSDYLKKSMVEGSETAAKNSMNAFRNALVTPLQTELQSIMTKTQTETNNMIKAKNIGGGTKVTKQTASAGTTNVFINNNTGSRAKAISKSQDLLQKLKV